MRRPERICFVSIEAYATLKPGSASIAGGAGFQVVEIGRRLRDRGHAISYVVGHFGQPFREVVDGFATYRASRVEGGTSLTRGPANVLRVLRAMRAAGADYYVLRSNRSLVFFVSIFARLLGARFAFMVANPLQVSPAGVGRMPRVLRALYGWSLRRAHLVTVQTEQQKRWLCETLGVEGVLVPNGIEVPAWPAPPHPKSHDVVWAGSIKRLKRPDRLLDIARALPGRSFLVAGGPGGDRAYYEAMVAAFAAQPNLTFAGFVAPDKVAEIYRCSRLFLMTSDYEGFPNTFLHAWASAVPVCSLAVDPDGVVAERGLGLVEADAQGLAGKIDALLDDQEAYAAMCRRCYEHVKSKHSSQVLETAFLEALLRRRA